MRDDSAAIFFQSFLLEAVASNSGMVGRDVYSFMLLIQYSSMSTTTIRLGVATIITLRINPPPPHLPSGAD